MAKETVYVGIACIGEGSIPKVGGLISLAGNIEKDVFKVNISPLTKKAWEKPRYLNKYPDTWEEILKDPIPLQDAMERFIAWLKRYSARYIAIGSVLDFYWLYTNLIGTTKNCPFGYNGFLDVRSVLGQPRKISRYRENSFIERLFLKKRLKRDIS